MHNKHFFRVWEKTPKQACNRVESWIEDYGTENNWRSVLSAVDSQDRVYNNAIGQDEDEDGDIKVWNTWEKIQSAIQEQIDGIPYASEAFNRCITDTTIGQHDWWSARKFCEWKFNQYPFLNKKFDIATSEFYSGEFDEVGLTGIDNDPEEGDQMYIVMVDMHS